VASFASDERQVSRQVTLGSIRAVPIETRLDHLIAELRNDVAADLHSGSRDGMTDEDRREMARAMILARLHQRSSRLVAEGGTLLDPAEEQMVAQSVLDSLFGMGRLQPLIEDKRIENIDVNGCDQVWITYADGSKVQGEPVAKNDEELVEILRVASARFGLSERRFDVAHPELDLQLPDGSRLSALMSVVHRPCVSIRRHRFVDLTLHDLVTLGTMDRLVASFLAAAVRARKNIVVAGAMNSGKTTLVRALTAEIPERERLITIEQALELGVADQKDRHPDSVSIEAREANVEGEGAIGMARLVRRSLRLNGDRIIVGEVLGDEVIPMLNAMSQGRSGSMCTVHSDSSAGVFRRLASYAVQAPERLPVEATALLVAGSVDFVVFLDVEQGNARERPDRRVLQSSATEVDTRGVFRPERRVRFVSSIREIVDADGMQVVSNEVFKPGPRRRATPGVPLRSRTLTELLDHGYDPSCPPGEVSW
jgi:pilus assembly protein CpaF